MSEVAEEVTEIKVPETRKIALAVVLTALGLAMSPIFIPVGPFKLNPGTHIVNVLAAILLGFWYVLAVSIAMAIIRNVLGVGTIYAFPGGVIPGIFPAIFYRYIWNKDESAFAELLGSLVGAIVAGLLVNPYYGREASLTVFIVGFLASSIAGTSIGYVILKALRASGTTPKEVWG